MRSRDERIEVGTPRECDGCNRWLPRGEEVLVLPVRPREGYVERPVLCAKCERDQAAERDSAMREDRDDAEREDRWIESRK